MHLDPKTFTLLPTGSYAATITNIEEVEGKYGGQLKLTFNLGAVEDVDGNVEERTLVGYTGISLSSKSKLWQWTQAAGLDPEEGLDTEDLIGRRVVLDVSIMPRSNGDGEFNSITNVRKPKAKAKPAPVADDGSEL